MFECLPLARLLPRAFRKHSTSSTLPPCLSHFGLRSPRALPTPSCTSQPEPATPPPPPPHIRCPGCRGRSRSRVGAEGGGRKYVDGWLTGWYVGLRLLCSCVFESAVEFLTGSRETPHRLRSTSAWALTATTLESPTYCLPYKRCVTGWIYLIERVGGGECVGQARANRVSVHPIPRRTHSSNPSTRTRNTSPSLDSPNSTPKLSSSLTVLTRPR